MDRRFLAAGVVATVAGVAFFANAALAFRFPVDHALVTIAAVTAGLLALVGTSTRLRTHRVHTPPPEPAPSASHPGAAVDDALETVRRGQHVDTADAREAVFDRLTAVAIQQLRDQLGVDADEAERRLATGEWTDDPEAAAFFQAGPADDAPLLTRLRESFTDDARFAQRARRVANALDELEDDP